MLNTRKEKCYHYLGNFKFILFTASNQSFLNKLRLSLFIIPFTIITLFLSSCSQEKHTFVSKNFHNTTAHYNAYFLAREKMKEVDMQIKTANIDDYNKVLFVYPAITEATIGTIKAPLEEVIKKASLINEKHKNSNWLDDSYVIIGKAYFYRHELPTAMAFFKFVNSNTKDDEARHAALVLLMRTYIDSADYTSAKSVSDYIQKKTEGGEIISEENAKDLYLTKAYYHQKLDEFEKMIPNLEKAEPNLKTRDEQARIHFILGQLYQAYQTDSTDAKAYNHYRKTIKKNPPYELLFHSKLYLTQVSELSKSSNRNRVERYFKKLLKDKKNLEYKDKIYYEIARYELRQNNTPKAINNLEKSLQVSSKNKSQKGLSYLKLGEIYYDDEKFDLSKVYYDSAVAVWDTGDKRYKAIASRQKTLAEFVGYKQTVHREDSLQRLAKMPKEQLDKFIDEIIVQEKEKEKELALQQKLRDKLAKQNANTPTIDMTGDNNSTFALTNPIAIISGKAEFIKIWGNRQLADNWRRSQKDNFDFAEDNLVDSIAAKKDTLIADPENEVVNKDIYYKDIPYTKGQVDTSNKKIEIALYNIGKIYQQKLNEPNNSIASFEDLLKRFPNSEYEAEIYYFIYLIYNNKNETQKSEVYKNKVLNEFPTSLYAKLLRNPNYLRDNKLANQQAHLKYKEAYDLYRANSYKAADSLIKITRIEFPDNDIDDKLALLNILILGQTSNAVVYKGKLQEFIDVYATSPLVPKAKELLGAADEFISKKDSKGEQIGLNDAKYSTELNKPHYLVAVLPKKVASKKVINEFNNYHRMMNEKGLTTEFAAFSDSSYAIVVKGFQEKFGGQVYLNKLKNEKSFFTNNGYIEHPVFIITDHNYELFHDSKNLNGYLNFFKEKY
jgi:tetratricopeptide (TPR) repeat protein